MVLGPSPECYLLLASRMIVPKALDAHEIQLELLWGAAIDRWQPSPSGATVPFA
jgi:hypothetical protein